MFCQGNGLNGILKRREDEARLLKWSVSEVVRSSGPSQNMVSSSQLPVRSSQPLLEVGSLERTPIRSSEPLPETCPLEPSSQFARPFLTRTSSLE